MTQAEDRFMGMAMLYMYGLELIRQVITSRPPCGAADGLGVPDGPYGRCNLPAGHDGDWHQEWRNGRLWAEWRGPHPGQACGICGKDGAEH